MAAGLQEEHTQRYTDAGGATRVYALSCTLYYSTVSPAFASTPTCIRNHCYSVWCSIRRVIGASLGKLLELLHADIEDENELVTQINRFVQHEVDLDQTGDAGQ